MSSSISGERDDGRIYLFWSRDIGPMLRLPSLLCLLAVAGMAPAQYPSKPITLIVAFGAGSDADLSARNLAHHSRNHLGNQTIVVANRPGASGAIGTLAARNAAA